MKLNKYQIVVFSWGLSVFIGYVFTPELLRTPWQLLVLWTAALAIPFFLQIMLMWIPQPKYSAIHLLWIVIGLVGGLLTYLGMYGYIDTFAITIHTFWLGLTALGMLATAAVLKNSSYVILAVSYAFPAVIFHFISPIKHDLIITGIIFLILGIIDALLEYSSLRKGLANFEEEKVI